MDVLLEVVGVILEIVGLDISESIEGVKDTKKRRVYKVLFLIVFVLSFVLLGYLAYKVSLL